MNAKLKLFAIVAGLALFAFFYAFNPLSLEPQASDVMAVAVMMLAWWLSEALPMPLVALLPLIMFPVLKVMKIDQAAASYGSPVVFLFLGGFMLGLAIEKWNLHRRIALGIVKVTGTSANRIILGFCIATGFLSMWLSNTATTMMMFPIAASVVSLMETQKIAGGKPQNFATALMLCLAYASNIGGIATLIGTPPNVVFRGLVEERYGYEVGFLDWMLICTPLAIILIGVMYLVLIRVFPNRMGKSAESAALIDMELKALGPLTKAEKRVMVVFVSTALCWILRDQINDLFRSAGSGIKLDDTIIALLGTFALFFTPVSLKENQFLLEWKDTSKMAWGVLLLFGGGLCLADALEGSGLIALTGARIAETVGDNPFWLMLMLTFTAIFLSELMSNVAQVTVFVPVVCGVADAMGVNPLFFAVPVTLGASCAFMLPMGTPPNAIVFGTGKIRMAQMAGVGFVLNLVSGVLISMATYLFLSLVMPWSN